MKCISCGAEVSGEVLGSLIKCEYCGTTNSFISRVTIEVNASDSEFASDDIRKIQSALNDIDQGEFADALDVLRDVSSTDNPPPTVFANMAVCTFWLGKDDFSHLPEVLKLLKKASLSSKGSGEIEPFIRSVVYNTAKIATLKNRYGSNLDNCTSALARTVDLVPNYPDRDELLTEFVKLNSESLVRDVWVHIKRDKKNFDAPRTLVSSLTNLVALDPTAHLEATALALICVNQRKEKFSDVSQSVLSSIRERYARVVGKSGDPKIEFPMFSGPKIVN